MSHDAYLNPKCWCGKDHSEVFSTDYRQCTSCGTLFLSKPLPKEHFAVTDDDSGFYGKKYWTKHLVADYGMPDLASRARADLPERNLHWLRTLLSYVLPERKVLEIACAHGSFVALLRQAGFDAAGLDLSPAMLSYAREVFGIPTIRGPVEDASIPEKSYAAIAAMDVLEHFAQPAASMSKLAALIEDDGLFLIQTPCLPDRSISLRELQARDDRFLIHLKEEEHIYLFNKDSATQLFSELGFPYVEFHDPIFDYDMFIAASRKPLPRRSPDEIAGALTRSLSGRMVLALLDLDERRREVHRSWQDAEKDRADRLEAIEHLGATLSASEKDRAARLELIEELSRDVAASEADRAARLELIEELSRDVAASEADRAARLELIEDLSRQVAASEADRAARLAVIEDLGRQLAASEADRAARLAVIEDLGRRLTASEADRAGQLCRIQEQTDVIAGLELRIATLRERLESVRRRLSDTIIGKALTRTGWISPPELGEAAEAPPNAPARAPDLV